jgi:hypothetical protein
MRNAGASPIHSPTGPATAIEIGMSASETKKSRLDTRPSIDGGTRRCSSVPHTTCAPSKSTPQMNTATTITQSHEV